MTSLRHRINPAAITSLTDDSPSPSLSLASITDNLSDLPILSGSISILFFYNIFPHLQAPFSLKSSYVNDFRSGLFYAAVWLTLLGALLFDLLERFPFLARVIFDIFGATCWALGILFLPVSIFFDPLKYVYPQACDLISLGCSSAHPYVDFIGYHLASCLLYSISHWLVYPSLYCFAYFVSFLYSITPFPLSLLVRLPILAFKSVNHFLFLLHSLFYLIYIETNLFLQRLSVLLYTPLSSIPLLSASVIIVLTSLTLLILHTHQPPIKNATQTIPLTLHSTLLTPLNLYTTYHLTPLTSLLTTLATLSLHSLLFLLHATFSLATLLSNPPIAATLALAATASLSNTLVVVSLSALVCVLAVRPRELRNALLIALLLGGIAWEAGARGTVGGMVSGVVGHAYATELIGLMGFCVWAWGVRRWGGEEAFARGLGWVSEG